jgi:hypothetical protein
MFEKNCGSLQYRISTISVKRFIGKTENALMALRKAGCIVEKYD